MIWWICVGLVAGWATGKLMKGGGYGAFMDIVIGIGGAVLGGFLMRTLGFAGSGGFVYSVVVAILGAVVLLWLIHMLTGRHPNS